MVRMKLLAIVCAAGLDDEVIGIIKGAGAQGYTHLENCTGEGRTGPHMDTAVWPGQHHLLLTCVDESIVPLIVEKVRAACQEYALQPPCRAFSWDAEILL
jgi:hypothetical protein